MGRNPDARLVGDAFETGDEPLDCLNDGWMKETSEHVLDVPGEEEKGSVLIVERTDEFKGG